ncbi:MFS transporter [Burkholderia pseudomultivorans]|uniref:Niacin/nicotinamide transporter NaiP n=1 Tax=Burkholderia pseudomultivorans TaxID=1207504 RepID=A0ABU2E4A0_9BURK|nr:MFS transporter [Burkholderia pseudomultivorans]MDR8729676.1 putative niacin/nicotinamide transporter NaiP [Burkholderia pseudomultivorans]MDR8736987.1 putative niacin/nicotinamide transporter NaiP [Burkholderia pseudomultivorans]MDR8743118.1 putative niacin/nicotinamide transporter NaiP [Burkholderia pseudomultivorans]MDR8754493.1 putative niacin/nicotinamide transporter NaiP [Burkholderia pseudomultivorans]MDR8779846.1 putative niacin/nicotinamide transporter NaiP [Burkholderia pseudomult
MAANMKSSALGDPSAPRVEQVGPYAWKALAGSAIGYAMDGFDLLILGFMLPAITAALQLTPGQGGALVTWTLIGAVAGGIVFGALSDRYGRVRVLTWTILLFAIFTGLCTFARGFWDLLVYRTIAGVGLGGEFGIGMALAAEAWPAGKRARVSCYVALGWQAGVLLAALLTPLLLLHIGWRGMFVVGVVPALLAWALRNKLHEPEVFVRRAAQPKSSAFRMLVADGRTARTSLGIVILCAVQNFGYYGIMIWLPTFLSKQMGFSLTKSGLWTATTVVGMMLGVWVFGQLADRIGRKPTFLLYQLGSVVTVVAYARLSDPTAMLWAGALMGMFVNGMVGGYGTLMSEGYPTAARATAQNVLWNIGRAIGGFGPVAVGALAAHYSFQTAIALLAGLYVLDMVATLFLIPELKGVELE